MIKVTYYIGTYDKDTCEKEKSDTEIINAFDELFENYTFQYANGVYTMRGIKEKVKEQTFIITTFVDDCTETTLKTLHQIQENCNILKKELNQETILVEITKPEVMFL